MIGARELLFEVGNGSCEGNRYDIFGVGGGFHVESDGGFVWVGSLIGHVQRSEIGSRQRWSSVVIMGKRSMMEYVL